MNFGGLGARLGKMGSGGNGGLTPPAGFAFIVNSDGAYLVNSDGAYLVRPI